MELSGVLCKYRYLLIVNNKFCSSVETVNKKIKELPEIFARFTFGIS